MGSLYEKNRRLRELRAEATARSKAVEEAAVDGILTIGKSRTIESANRLACFEDDGGGMPCHWSAGAAAAVRRPLV